MKEKETSIPLQRDSESQCRRGKAIPASFLKIEGGGKFVGAKDQRERDG